MSGGCRSIRQSDLSGRSKSQFLQNRIKYSKEKVEEYIDNTVYFTKIRGGKLKGQVWRLEQETTKSASPCTDRRDETERNLEKVWEKSWQLNFRKIERAEFVNKRSEMLVQRAEMKAKEMCKNRRGRSHREEWINVWQKAKDTARYLCRGGVLFAEVYGQGSEELFKVGLKCFRNLTHERWKQALKRKHKRMNTILWCERTSEMRLIQTLVRGRAETFLFCGAWTVPVSRVPKNPTIQLSIESNPKYRIKWLGIRFFEHEHLLDWCCFLAVLKEAKQASTGLERLDFSTSTAFGSLSGLIVEAPCHPPE